MFGSSNRTIIQTQTSKTTQKWVTEHKTRLLLQFSDLNPTEDELKRRSCESEGSGEILEESEGSGEILDESEGSGEILDESEGSGKILDESEGSGVILDEPEGSGVILD